MSNTDPTRVFGAITERTMVAPAAGGGATMQMPASGLDPLRTQMGGTATCAICGSNTPLPATYCGDCGYLLSSAPPENVSLPAEEKALAELVDVQDGRRYRLREGVNTLGRQGTDILVNEGTISRTHARITLENGTILIEDLGSTNGTKVGDRRLSANEPTPAAHGTTLKFGNWRTLLEVAGGGSAEATVAVTTADRTIAVVPDKTVVGMPTETAPAAEADTPMPVSSPAVSDSPAILTGPVVALLQKIEGMASDIPVQFGVITVGRRSSNHIALPQDAYISGRHAEITTDNSGTYLTDLGSTNGTLINGQKLEPHERQLLLEGDEVQLGQTRYKFLLLEPDMEESESLPPLVTDHTPAEMAPTTPAEETNEG